MEQYLQQYAARVCQAICALDWGALAGLSRVLGETVRDGRRIFVFGNGACAAAASHFVCDLAKGLTADPDIPRVKALALNDCVPLLTAWANDADYAEIFRQPLANYLERGDLVIGLSASGNSPNVVNALAYGRERGGVTAAVAGKGGGKAAGLVDHLILVKNDSYEEVEDVIVAVTHMLKMAVLDHYREIAGGA
ncbi:MAG TPA: SIS domain-containing protein [bacterium]|nr:SIS domain-containing protein [bacterium]HPJ72260.1 SIS domain-containing protein [bacterium]HPQ65574.1 SIS domain-containing protein [bacterium]